MTEEAQPSQQPGSALPRLRLLVLGAFLVFCCVGYVGGLMGALHPAGDTLSLAAPIFALFGFLAGVMLGGLGPKLISLGFLVALGTYLHAVLGPSGAPGAYLLYQKNLWYRNAELGALAEDIRISGADFVTLQEVSNWNGSLLDDLKGAYPHQHLCDFSRWSRIAVLSRHRLVEGTQVCSAWRGIAAAQVETPDGLAWVASIHLPWPYPYRQTQALEMIEPILAAFEGPVAIGADFNTFPNTRVTRRVAQLARGQEMRPLSTTFVLEGIPIILDHVIAPSGTLERRPLLGSDHYGLLAHIDLTQ